jgi:DUF4097 and DUF4098 domain-containing protein YvlB
MLRFFVRLTAVAVVASLPYPLYALEPQHACPTSPEVSEAEIGRIVADATRAVRDATQMAAEIARDATRTAARVHADVNVPQLERLAADIAREAPRLAAELSRSAGRISREASRSAARASREAGWSAKTWRESWEDRQGPEQTERITKSFKVGPSGTLDISNVSGNIVVTAGGGDAITVDAVKRSRGRGSDSKGQLEAAQVTMVERAGRVEVKTTYERGSRNIRTSVDYTVTAPAGTAVFAHSISGDVRIAGVRGEVRADTVSGNVEARDTPGATLVKTISGDTTISGVSNQNELRASSVSGTVVVSGARIRALDADSISGDVRLTNVTSERTTAKSISGGIHFDGPLAKSGRYEFKSQSGDIHLALSGPVGFELDASSFSGSVRSDLPITIRPGESIGGRGPGKKIHGVHGDGSAQLIVGSFSGDITIAKR